MNILFIVVIVILAIGVLAGLKIGFTDMLFEMATTLVSMIAAVVLCSPVAKIIMQNEKMMTGLIGKINNVLKLKELAQKAPSAQDFLNNIAIPDVIKDKIVSGDMLQNFDNKTDVTVNAMADSVANFIGMVIIYAACFIVIFIVAIIALNILNHFFDLVNKIPGIKQTNKLLGAAFGLVIALMIVWAFFAVITLFSANPWGANLLQSIAESKFLSFIYNNNFPMQIITKKVEGLF